MKNLFPLLAACSLMPMSILAQGSLTPPAAPTPTMKSLDQVEARTIINATNTPGNSTNLFIIGAPGSYYLTGNITGVSGKNGVLISANNVTLDLNGFALVGVSGSLAGIYDGNTAFSNIDIRRGNVRSWGGAGINLSKSNNSQLADLMVTNNGGIGINLGTSCAIRDCLASDNPGGGIYTGTGANILHCTAQNSSAYGFNLGNYSNVGDSVAASHVSYGITTGSSCTVSRCTVSKGSAGGITTGNGCTIVGCTVSGNGDGSFFTNGISTSFGCSVIDCTVSQNNVHTGISANYGSTITHCTASYNTSSQDNSSGIFAVGSTIVNCTASENSSTFATASHTTGMGIWCDNTGSDTSVMIKNCTVFGNKGDGINVRTRCLVLENICSGNGFDGIHATGAINRIDSNHTIYNGGIGINATNDWVVRNTSGANTGGNIVGAGADIAPTQTANAATNPFANLP